MELSRRIALNVYFPNFARMTFTREVSWSGAKGFDSCLSFRISSAASPLRSVAFHCSGSVSTRQILYPASPTGTGWVYSAYVTVSGGELPVIEPPPTPTPPVTATVDLTFIAALNMQPTQTRLPTFTPPPPLTVPAFAEPAPNVATGTLGIFIVGLGLIGAVGLVISFVISRE